MGRYEKVLCFKDRQIHKVRFVYIKHYFLENGFKQDERFNNCFVKEGYGSFLTNVSFKTEEKVLAHLNSSEFYKYYSERGCKLVVGPAAPANNGIVYDKFAVYIANYEEFYSNKCNNNVVPATVYLPVVVEESLELTTEELNKIVSKAGLLARGYETVMLHCGMGFNLGDVLDTEIKKISDYEKELMDKYNDKDLYAIIDALKEYISGDKVEGKNQINHMISTLSDNLYKRIVKDEDIDSSAKVADLVKQAERYANDYSTINMHTSMGFNFGEQVDSSINSIYGLVSKVTTECSLPEVRGVVKGINELYEKRGMPKGASFIVDCLNADIYDKTFNEHFVEKDKTPKTKH